MKKVTPEQKKPEQEKPDEEEYYLFHFMLRSSKASAATTRSTFLIPYKVAKEYQHYLCHVHPFEHIDLNKTDYDPLDLTSAEIIHIILDKLGLHEASKRLENTTKKFISKQMYKEYDYNFIEAAKKDGFSFNQYKIAENTGVDFLNLGLIAASPKRIKSVSMLSIIFDPKSSEFIEIL